MVLLALACVENGLNGPEEEVVVPVRSLVVSPTGIDFGEVEMGAQRTEVFTLESVGTGAVTLDGLEFTGPNSFELTWFGVDEVLEPGDTVDVAVHYTAQSLYEEARIGVRSNAAEVYQEVELSGTAIAPMLVIEPSSMELVSPDGSVRQDEFVLRSAGTQTLVIDDFILLTDHDFTVEGAEPTSLEPGEWMVVDVTWEPSGTENVETAELWITDNTPLGSALAPIRGVTPPPCLGLAEAWNTGSLYARVDGTGTMVLENQDPEFDICIDTWTIWISAETQDMALGDQGMDPGGEYPLGSLTMGPGEEQRFYYGGTSGNAWYCVEQTQLTEPTDEWTFFGARVPPPLLTRSLQGDQDAVWEYEQDHPAPAVGRDTNAVVPGETVVLRSVNLGRQLADFRLTETLPAGWEASNFTLPPDQIWTHSDDSTSYSWDLSLAGAIDTGEYEPTIYDWSIIRYTLELDGAECSGRTYLEEVEATWLDLDGDSYTSRGSPLLVTCD